MKNRKIFKIILGIVLGLCVCIGIGVFAKLGKINRDTLSEEEIVVSEEAQEAGEGYTNVVLFGIDSREGELESGTRSDSIIIASLNNRTKEVRLVSVYRDTILDIAENNLQKCNAAYSYGGPMQAINMLNKNLDLDIKDYVTVDFAAVANAIDCLGGIEIDVREEEIGTLNKYVHETARVAGKTANTVTAPGLQLLDGVQATTYARIRSTEGGDFTRTQRQRLVIEKMVEKAQKSDLATINKIINELFPTIYTSFSIREILSYAKDFTKYTIGKSEGFPFEKTTDTFSGLGSIVIPVTLESNVIWLHEFLYDVPAYMPSEQVIIIDGAIFQRVSQATRIENVSNEEVIEESDGEVIEESDGEVIEDVNPEDEIIDSTIGEEGSGENNPENNDDESDTNIVEPENPEDLNTDVTKEE